MILSCLLYLSFVFIFFSCFPLRFLPLFLFILFVNNTCRNQKLGVKQVHPPQFRIAKRNGKSLVSKYNCYIIFQLVGTWRKKFWPLIYVSADKNYDVFRWWVTVHFLESVISSDYGMFSRSSPTQLLPGDVLHTHDVMGS